MAGRSDITLSSLGGLAPVIGCTADDFRQLFGLSPLACPDCGTPNVEFPCAACGYQMSADTAQLYRDAAYELAYYGWLYPLKYAEDDVKGRTKGRVVHYKLIEPSEAWIYIASLVVSGIVGNLAYDALKTAIRAAQGHVKALMETRHDPRSQAWDLRIDLSDDELLEALIYLADERRSRRVRPETGGKLRNVAMRRMRKAVPERKRRTKPMTGSEKYTNRERG